MASKLVLWLCLVFLGIYHTSCNNCVPSTSGTKVAKQPWSNCRLLFNEVDFATLENNGFIELSKYCNEKQITARQNDLKDFKVVMINAAGEIIITCQLKGSTTFKKDETRVKMVDAKTAKKRIKKQKKEHFYVIGESGVTSANLKFSDCERDEEFVETLPSGETYPFGLMLLYEDRGTDHNSISLIPDMTSKTKYRKKTLNRRHMERIEKHIQDFYHFGSTTSYRTCEFFDSICQYSQNKNKLLRDWNSEEHEVKSLNRCGEGILPFDPDAWKYAFPSPGSDNYCADAIEFSLEQTVPQMAEPRQQNVDFVNKCFASNQNPNSGELEIDEQVLDNFFQDNNDEENNNNDEGLNINLEDEDSIITQSPVENINSYLNFYDKNLVKRNHKYIWDDCKQIDPKILENMSNDIDVNHVLTTDICPWISFEEDDTKKYKASCSFCKTLHKKNFFAERESSLLLSTFLKSGHWNQGSHRKTENRDMLTSHSTNPLHKIAVQYYKQLDDGLEEAAFNKAMMATNSSYHQYYAPTERFIVAVYASVKMGLPFLKFPVLAEILKFANYDMGRLHATPQGAKKGLKVISECMHKELLYHLKINKPYFTVVIDDSTDVSGTPNSEILFQTYNADKHVKTYHYFLLELKDGMTGRAIFETFYSQIKKDKLEDILRDKAIGMTSDGAPTLKYKFFDLLQEQTKHHLIFQHCQAHRLELVIKHSLTSFAYLKQIDSKINQIALQFNSKATKKKAILKREAKKVVTFDENGQIQPNAKTFEIRRIHPIRWISHKTSAYTSVLNHWVEIIRTNQEILTRKDFNKKSKQRAQTLLTYLLDPTFLSHVAFLADIGNLFSKMSLELQTQNSNLIGKMRLRSQLIESLETYSQHGGYHLKKLLRRAVAIEDDSNGPIVPDTTTSELLQSLHLFEFSKNVINETELGDPTKENMANNTLVGHFQSYLDAMLEHIDGAFDPEEIFNSFDMFHPQNIAPLGIDDTTGKFDLQKINVNYHLKHDMDSLYDAWRSLVNSIVAEPKFTQNRELRPETFWTYYLLANNIAWTDDLRNIIEKILVIPATSSSAERSFSFVTALKTTKRYSMETPTIDMELRIKLNGEKKLAKINSFTYAREFIKQYTKVDDMFRALPSPVIEDEKRVDGGRMRSIFEKPEI